MTKISGIVKNDIVYAEKTDGLNIRPLSYILCASNIPDEIYFKLHSYAENVIKLPPFDLLQKPVSTHPDMLVFDTDELLILNKKYYLENKALFDEISQKTGRQIVGADEEIYPEYPFDIRYNCLKLGELVLGRADFVSSEIKSRYKITDVKQGYARCSCCKINEKAIITADKSLYKAASENGIDALLISSGNISLCGYDYGFIGGASANILNKIVLFFGSIENHPDYIKIMEFAEKHNTEIKPLSPNPLCDFGGAITL